MCFTLRMLRWPVRSLLNVFCLAFFVIIIHMKKFLDSDWLKAVQFFS